MRHKPFYPQLQQSLKENLSRLENVTPGEEPSVDELKLGICNKIAEFETHDVERDNKRPSLGMPPAKTDAA